MSKIGKNQPSSVNSDLKKALLMLTTCLASLEQFTSNEYVYGEVQDFLLTDIHKFIKECNENHC